MNSDESGKNKCKDSREMKDWCAQCLWESIERVSKYRGKVKAIEYAHSIYVIAHPIKTASCKNK